MAEVRALPDDIAARIKSSVTITSLKDVVLGLLKNSLDAGSTWIDLELDFGHGSCTVEDNGKGIAPPDFGPDGGLGRLYHTSHFEDDGPHHGKFGVFLASTAALSVLTIISRHHLHASTSALMFHHSRPVARLLPAPEHLALKGRSHGTRVRVQDLFGNMPVRVLQRPGQDERSRMRVREWEAVSRSIIGLLLAWPHAVSVSASCPETGQQLRIRIPSSSSGGEDALSARLPSSELFNVPKVSTVLSQGLGISSTSMSRWVKASAHATSISIRGLISLEPVPTRQSQFICLGVHHLEYESIWKTLYDEVNAMFTNSSFGSVEETDHAAFAAAGPRDDRRFKRGTITLRRSPSSFKSVDRCPIFFIRIDMEAVPEGVDQASPSPGTSNVLASISQVLGAMISRFLVQHQFRKARRTLRESTIGVHQGELTKRVRPGFHVYTVYPRKLNN